MRSVEEKLSSYEHALRQARAEAYALTESERAAAIQERQKKLGEMRQSLAESIAQEKEAINREAEAARATLETQARALAQEIGARVIGRPLGGPATND
jgi:F0F1-type ATP synthase membrane subunit b/b'